MHLSGMRGKKVFSEIGIANSNDQVTAIDK